MRNDGARLKITRVANASEFVAQPRAIRANRVECIFNGKPASVDQRTHHVRLVPDTFFVGECANGDGPLRL